MGFFLDVSASILTAVLVPSFVLVTTARASETTASCSNETSGARALAELAWMEDLSKMLNASVLDSVKGVATPSPGPTPSFTPFPWTPWWSGIAGESEFSTWFDDDPPSGKYNLPDKELEKLSKAAYAAAKKCRTDKKSKSTLCGIRVSKASCYAGVKDALVSSGIVDLSRWSWGEIAAVDAHESGTLKNLGFKNVIQEGYTSLTAPLGAVLVYSGGRAACPAPKGRLRPCGHIEVRLRENYCSDFCKSIPADGYINRKLVGVYVKK